MNVKSAIKNAGRTLVKAVSPPPEATERDLLDTLKSEHDEVKALLMELQDAEGAQRKALVKQIKLALVPHTKAEEKVLYAAVIALRDKECKIDGHEGALEHELASKTLQKLAAITSAASPEHRAAAKVLKELIEHHIQEEESNLWRDARKHFSEEERVALNKRYLALKARVNVA